METGKKCGQDLSPEHFDGAAAAPAASSIRSDRSDTRTPSSPRARRSPWRRCKTCCFPPPLAASHGSTSCGRSRRSRSGCVPAVTIAEAVISNQMKGLMLSMSTCCASHARSLQYGYFMSVPPHLLMTKPPARVVLGDVGALVTVSSARGRHLRVRARPAPRKHLKW